MKPDSNPSRLNVAALAATGARLEGRSPLAGMARLAESTGPETAATPREVIWSAVGEQRERRGAAPEIWLRLQAQVTVLLSCQRCLQPMEQLLAINRGLRFAATETQAAALDAELEDDVLELTRSLDLIELIEDELLLALPLVPRHADCPQPLVAREAPDSAGETPPHPFAALKDFRTPGSGH